MYHFCLSKKILEVLTVIGVAALIAASVPVTGASVGDVDTLTGASVGDVDTVDTEAGDAEAALKCDACILVASKLSDGFKTAESNMRSVRITDQQVSEAAEGVCDGTWKGYGTLLEGDSLRLGGPGTGRELSPPSTDSDSIWSHRLQDLCDELLSEATSDKQLYDTWSVSSDALELFLCKGEGTFSACATHNWGPWPGDDDYEEDYDDGDFEYTHDEF